MIYEIYFGRFGTDTVCIAVFNRHFVLGKCSCLVRAYYRHTAKPLNCLQLPYNCMLLSHFLRAKGQHYSYNRA